MRSEKNEIKAKKYWSRGYLNQKREVKNLAFFGDSDCRHYEMSSLTVQVHIGIKSFVRNTCFRQKGKLQFCSRVYYKCCCARNYNDKNGNNIRLGENHTEYYKCLTHSQTLMKNVLRKDFLPTFNLTIITTKVNTEYSVFLLFRHSQT